MKKKRLKNIRFQIGTEENNNEKWNIEHRHSRHRQP